MPRREHKGSAAASTLNGGINATDLSITLAAGGGTGWPTGAVGPFFVTIDRDVAAEERVLVTSRTGDVLTVASTGDRGVDDTTATSHSAGAAIEHTLAAAEVDEHNTHMFTTTRDDHTQYMHQDGSRHDLTARHSVGTVIPAGTPVDVSTAVSAGVATTAARSDHVHGIADNAVGTTELASTSVTTAKIAALAVGTAQIAADAITNAKIADDAVAGENVTAFAEEISEDIPAWGPVSVDTDITTFSIVSRPYRRVAYFTAVINYTAETDQTGDILWTFHTDGGGAGTELTNAQTRQSTTIPGTGGRASVALAASISVAANTAQLIALRVKELQGTIHIKSVTSPGARPGDITGIIVPIGAT